MDNLEAAMADKKLADVESAPKGGGSNLIEPTKAEIESILTALKDGTSPQDIKKTFRRTVGESKLGFSFAQIKEIDDARLAKVAELTPKQDV